jgi:hypothetical protein
LIDTSTAASNVSSILGVFAEEDRNAARDRYYVTRPEDRGANIVILDEELADGGAV